MNKYYVSNIENRNILIIRNMINIYLNRGFQKKIRPPLYLDDLFNVPAFVNIEDNIEEDLNKNINQP